MEYNPDKHQAVFKRVWCFYRALEVNLIYSLEPSVI